MGEWSCYNNGDGGSGAGDGGSRAGDGVNGAFTIIEMGRVDLLQ